MVPVRTKAVIAPYVLLLLVGLLVADDWGVIDLGLEPAGQHRRRPPSAAAAPASRAARAAIPARYLRLYRQAGERYGMPWQVLAAVGKVESDHGRARGSRPGGSSSAGALGPMQFMPGTWARYGRGSVYDPAAAIPAAARKLRADGAPRHLDRALHLYNSGRPYCRCSAGYAARVKALARSYGRR